MNNIRFTNAQAEQAFLHDLKTEVHQHFAGRPIAHADWRFWAKGGCWFALSYGACALLLLGHLTAGPFWAVYLVFNLAGLLIGFSWGHDASHSTAFRRHWANQWLHFVSFLTVGIDPLLWGLRHLRSHHIYANVEGSDIDIDRNPFLRLSPAHPWRPYHRYQAWYAPLVYLLTLAHSVFWGDWVYLLHPDYEWMRQGVGRGQLWLRFFGFKVGHFALMLGLPLWLTDFSVGWVLFTYFSTGALCALTFIIMLVGTHFFLEADYPTSEHDRPATVGPCTNCAPVATGTPGKVGRGSSAAGLTATRPITCSRTCATRTTARSTR
jgi:linoleoyl-CoA desaturase